ncbi:MAG: hypothetical protein KC636_29615, partial [Myxococcales bacterium]|nr:hypothetical protein [Myxococcales bacterium]
MEHDDEKPRARARPRCGPALSAALMASGCNGLGNPDAGTNPFITGASGGWTSTDTATAGGSESATDATAGPGGSESESGDATSDASTTASSDDATSDDTTTTTTTAGGGTTTTTTGAPILDLGVPETTSTS